MNDSQNSTAEGSSVIEDGKNPVDQSPRVAALEKAIFSVADRLNPFIDFARPYVDGIENLPRDGRFLLVGNHTVVGSMAETVMIPYVVHRELGVRVRGLADRAMTKMPGPVADVFEAAGAVVGTPANGAALMAAGETVLVFPGGGREMPKFKGEKYQLNWEGRSGFARLAIEHGYPIVPAASVGGDDIFHGTIERDGMLGRASQLVGRQLFGRSDVSIPLMRGWGPTLIPDPKRLYLRFGQPISTTPTGDSASAWEASVKEQTKRALEHELASLQRLRQSDPYRNLNPAAWNRALRSPQPMR
ncbi:lysophospholipid acyltransferase family protein [Mycolicibacterium sp. 22603]|uniref:lysophospholipid acyltransferase family protein n=1 Tax=Mycolicibacterium sp. 22603 TaxID=3453950 RepID=UPI003F858970